MATLALHRKEPEAWPEPESLQLVIRRHTITRVLLATVGILTLLSLIGQISKYFLGTPYLLGFVPLFYVDMEANVPTWYETMALAFAAVLLAALAFSAHRTNAPFAWHWSALSLLFLFMSLDEAAGLHEATMNPLQRITGPLEGAWQPVWVFPAIAAVCVVGALFLRFFFHLPWRDRLQVFSAAALFVGGAVGVEILTSSLLHIPFSYTWTESFPFALLAHLEELLEMLGVVVLIDFLLRRLSHARSFSLKVSD